MSKKRNIPKKIKRNPRYAALELLVQVSEKQAYSNLLVNEKIKQAELSPKDARLMTEIVYGTIGRKLTLEYFLSHFIKKGKKIDTWVEQLLYLSLYQMVYLDKVPAHGIVNDAVEIAKVRGNVGIGGFVNGVLRNVQRKGVPSTDLIADEIDRLSVEISLPKWLTKKFVVELGMEETKELGLSLLQPSHVSARVDTTQESVAEALTALEEEHFDVSLSEVSPVGLVATRGFLPKSTLFVEGVITMQDESSMLVAPAMQLESHHQVLDACAAPGGKTTHIASYLSETAGGKVTALDIHQHKIKLIKDNAARLGVLERVEPMLLDARKVKDTFEDDSFDRILIDAPCSGLGLLRRKPDIKYNKTPEDFKKLQAIQLEILESVVTKVAQWGIITYSTCTMTSEENQEVIQTFLERHDNFEKIEVQGATHLTKSYHDDMLQLYPHHYHTDGFFISCLRRKA